MTEIKRFCGKCGSISLEGRTLLVNKAGPHRGRRPRVRFLLELLGFVRRLDGHPPERHRAPAAEACRRGHPLNHKSDTEADPMENLAITCDACGGRVAKAFRTRIRFGVQHVERLPLDLCPDCCDTTVLEPLGLIPKGLPFGNGEPTPMVDKPEGDHLTVHTHERKAR
jgi:hypothetical protein